MALFEGNLENEEVFFQVNTVALSIGGFVAFSLLIWDFICFIPNEFHLIRKIRWVELKMPDPWAFFVVRWSALGFAISALFNSSLKTEQCQFVTSLAQAFAIGVVAAHGVLVAKRTVILWANDCAVLTLLSTIYVAMIGSWIATATQHRSTKLPEESLPPFGNNCSINDLPPWNPVNYGSSMLFFTLTFFLSLYRLLTQRKEYVTNVGLTPLNRACVWYFMVSAATSTALFIVSVDWHSQWTTQTAKRIAAPFFVFLISAMGERLYLNNRADELLRKRHLRELALNPEGFSPAGDGRSTFNGRGGRLRWSFVPSQRKPGSPLTTLPYPRPPPPPPSIPISPLPPQHMAPIEKSRKISLSSESTSGACSSMVKPSPPPSRPKTASSQDTNGNASSIYPPTASSPSSAESEALTFSPMSSIAFHSPTPGSPPVLSLPGLGGRKKGQKQRQTGSSSGSGVNSQPGTPGSLKRLPSLKSGWSG